MLIEFHGSVQYHSRFLYYAFSWFTVKNYATIVFPEKHGLILTGVFKSNHMHQVLRNVGYYILEKSMGFPCSIIVSKKEYWTFYALRTSDKTDSYSSELIELSTLHTTTTSASERTRRPSRKSPKFGSSILYSKNMRTVCDWAVWNVFFSNTTRSGLFRIVCSLGMTVLSDWWKERNVTIIHRSAS